MNIFLKLKHWQLFGLFLCTYFAFQIAGTTTVILSQGTIKEISEHNYFGYKITTVVSSREIAKDSAEFSTGIPLRETTVKTTKYPPIAILFIVVLFGWFYAVGVNLNKKLPETVKMNLTRFKWFFLIPIIYMFLFWVFVYFVFFKSVSNGIEPNLLVFAVIIPLHLFSVFCIFYCIYFNAKSLKSVELQRLVTFSDYVKEFFLFLFFPIGVWVIQPKINKMFDDTLQSKGEI